MGVQTTRASEFESTVAPTLSSEVVSSSMGVVNFYFAKVDLGPDTGYQFRLMLKEYPGPARALALQEVRVYARLFGPQQGFFEELAADVLQAEEGFGSGAAPAGSAHVPRLYAAFDATLHDMELVPYVDADDGPTTLSTWLAFRYGEHGRTTLLDYTPAHYAQLEPQDERIGEVDMGIGQMLSIFNPFERVPEDPATKFGRFAHAVLRESLSSLDFVHRRGVVHTSISGACLLLNSVQEEDYSRLQVRLFNFGFAEMLDDEKGVAELPEQLINAARARGATTEEAIYEYARRRMPAQAQSPRTFGRHIPAQAQSPRTFRLPVMVAPTP
ncbi:hypothetical protein CYMTET_30985, partial [Cymbomonas tetramitiformis]